MNKKLLINIFLLLFIITSINISYATLEIEITQGVDAAVPIAVADFEVVNNIKNNKEIDFSVLSTVINDDLYRSGLFKPFIFENNNKLDQNTVSNLYSKGAEYIITGVITANPYDRYNVKIELIDLYQLLKNNITAQDNKKDNKQKLDTTTGLVKKNNNKLNNHILYSKSFDISAKYLRDLAHYLSDLVYEQLTGIRGVFSTKIAYVNVQWLANNKKKYTLEIADSDGYNPQPLVISSEPIMSPSWKPDGKYIAFVSFEGHRSKIKTVELATGNLRTISSFKGINGAPAWSPDGNKLALVLSQENIPKVYILNLLNNNLTKITSGSSIDTEPRWKPDGRALIFTSNRGGGPQIYQYNLDNKKIDRLTYDGAYNARADISKSGNKLVMVHKGDDTQFKIAVQDLDSYNVDVLTDSSLDESPSISANGQQIIYATKKNGSSILAEVSVDGRVKINRPATNGDVQEPAWSPYLS